MQGLSQEWIFVMGEEGRSDARLRAPQGAAQWDSVRRGLGQKSIGSFSSDSETLGKKSTLWGPAQGESPRHELNLRGQFFSVAGAAPWAWILFPCLSPTLYDGTRLCHSRAYWLFLGMLRNQLTEQALYSQRDLTFRSRFCHLKAVCL